LGSVATARSANEFVWDEGHPHAANEHRVSEGAYWLGMPTRQGPVLGVSCEDDEAELHRRHVAIKKAMGVAVGNPFADVWLWARIGAENTLVSYGRDGSPILTAFHAELTAKVEELNPALLILDTLADVYAGDELNRPQMNYFAKRVPGGLIRSQKQRAMCLRCCCWAIRPSPGCSKAGGALKQDEISRTGPARGCDWIT
jgi:hypothetical protein